MRQAHLRIFVHVALLGMIFYGCAAHQVRKETAPWQCNREADAAFAGGDWQAALSGHEQLLASEPKNCLALYHLGYIMGQLGDRPRETALYRQALDCGYQQDDQLFFNLGMALGDQGDLAGAREALQKAVALDPGNPDHYFGLGLTEQAAGRPDEARKAFEQTIRLAPKDWDAHLVLAGLLLDLEQWDQAAVHINAVLAADPTHEEALELRRTLQNRSAMQYN